MTLSRQLITLILTVFLLIFSGTFWISVENTRSYLMDQLATQTQNSASSLGVSLIPHMKKKDIATMNTMVNALFDSGYYQSLSITSISGEVLIQRQNNRMIAGVPEWFINRLPLQAASAETMITTGWSQAGRLQLVAHPGFAYQKLWQTTLEIFWWSMIAFMIALIGTTLILRTILKPLDDVERQADAICNREFPIVERVPGTRELRRVVEAMNRLSIKVKSSINSLTERAEIMRREANFDDLTGLMNRRGFLASLEHNLKDREHTGCGALLLIRLSHFSDYNKQHGFQGGDDLLIAVASLINTLSAPYLNATTARSKGAEFSVMLPMAITEDAVEFAEQCSSALTELSASLGVDGIAHIGLVPFQHDESIPSLLSHADTALASALHQGLNSYFCSANDSDAGSSQAWERLINSAMENNTIRLLSQPIMNSDNSPLYRETVIRIQDEGGQEIAPGTFAAMADRLALNRDLDCHVIKRVTDLLESGRQTQPLAINLSTRSVHHRAFIGWLESHLQAHPTAASNMLFEISEHAMLERLDISEQLIGLIHAAGGKVVMEHFGRKLSAFQTLSQLKLDYIKLDGSYVRNISENSDNRFFLQTIIDIAHGLDIQVIAEHVESDADRESLQSLGINAMQGYLFEAPTALA
ncbi:EAL domain-containing protein [Mariprofundus sp. NF]|uniref:EAL domain-containing protein n=1 Tax=Mariprofundus sp. NF TaxID=2608716 RepID=UPI0015A2FF1C|nr:EAL domain-containing protein [Mariprofundus sp. NF]NWF37673.1 EAL domain-containing protein [Mariprofundus sp. NF]